MWAMQIGCMLALPDEFRIRKPPYPSGFVEPPIYQWPDLSTLIPVPIRHEIEAHIDHFDAAWGCRDVEVAVDDGVSEFERSEDFKCIEKASKSYANRRNENTRSCLTSKLARQQRVGLRRSSRRNRMRTGCRHALQRDPVR